MASYSSRKLSFVKSQSSSSDVVMMDLRSSVERERDELRAKLAEAQKQPTLAAPQPYTSLASPSGDTLLMAETKRRAPEPPTAQFADLNFNNNPIGDGG